MVTQQIHTVGKKNTVRSMFNEIATSYDFLNHLLSGGVDIVWRKKMIRLVKQYQPEAVLDMATGTADLAIEAAKATNAKITGIDLSNNMVRVGRLKVDKKNLSERISLHVGDAENIIYDNDTFDLAMISFGVRNFENLKLGLQELGRVLQHNKPLIVLEFSKPEKYLVNKLYRCYSQNLLPYLGKKISKDDFAYRYLPDSIEQFPSGDEFLEIMQESGFTNCRQIKLSQGIASIYIGHKS